MNILVTGSNGFLGKSFIKFLNEETTHKVFQFSKNNYLIEIEKIINELDFVFHFAGINRTDKKINFEKINVNLTKKICEIISRNKNTTLVYASSTQIKLKNDYGKSKKKGEEVCLDLEKRFNNRIHILRLPGIFGIGCKPNYNSVVATFCFNVANKIDLNIINPNKEIELLYIDDLCQQLNNLIIKNDSIKFIELKNINKISIKDLANTIKNFKNNYKTKFLFQSKQSFERNLYKTYISFIKNT